MNDISYITNSHPAYIENLYHDFLKNPESVDADMRKFFEGFDFAVANANGKEAKVAMDTVAATCSNRSAGKRIFRISAYPGLRKKGHLIAKTNPIRERKDRKANLDLKFFNLVKKTWKQNFTRENLRALVRQLCRFYLII